MHINMDSTATEQQASRKHNMIEKSYLELLQLSMMNKINGERVLFSPDQQAFFFHAVEKGYGGRKRLRKHEIEIIENAVRESKRRKSNSSGNSVNNVKSSTTVGEEEIAAVGALADMMKDDNESKPQQKELSLPGDDGIDLEPSTSEAAEKSPDNNAKITYSEEIETDYLIIGAGATGMAFLDELLHRTKNTSFVIVDREAQPGGHWHHAYPFVRLHQGSHFYGVNSEQLERGRDKVEYASKYEILSYYERVKAKMIATGRVTFLSLCEYVGDGKVRSLVACTKGYHIKVKCKTVDAIYSSVKVPSTHVPNYKVARNVNFLSVNDLASLKGAYDQYVIIGSGKTGIDAILFLLDHGVNASKIKWVISRDVWWYNRNDFAPSEIIDFEIKCFKAIAEEDTVEGVFNQLEQNKTLMRIDESVKPSAFRCASITPEELVAVKGIKEHIRFGRVQRIEEEKILFERGEISTGPSVLHVDCTACGLPRRPAVPVFKDKNTIVLQPLITCVSVLSAAVIAMLEAKEADIEINNSMSAACPNPDTPETWVQCMLITMKNFDALKPHQKDFDAMRLNPLTNGVSFIVRIWKLFTQLAPIIPTLLEKAETIGEVETET